MRAETFSEQIFFTTVRLEKALADGTVRVGTGFLVEYLTDRGPVPVLVTNKHVIEDAVTLTAQMVALKEDHSEGHEPALGTAATAVLSAADLHIRGLVAEHPDPAVDVATIAFNPFAEACDRMPFYRAFPPGLFLSDELADQLDALLPVLFPGYPNGLFDTQSFLPIVRRGQTATPISVDYRGTPSFLIDASVFPGSSGSPVFLFQEGYWTRSSEVNLFGRRIAFLGVVAAVHQAPVIGKVIDLPTATQAAVLAERLDLGIVYKSHTVQECVDVLFARHSMTIVEEPDSDPASAT